MTTTNIDFTNLVDYVLDTHEIHSVFTTLLRTLSRPGEVQPLEPALVQRIHPAALPLLALVGHRTPFCVIEDDNETPTAPFIERVTGGCAVALADASYVAFLRPPTETEIAQLRQGDALHPEHAAQISVALSNASNKPSTLKVSGPGVNGSISVRLPHVPDALLTHLSTIPSSFPAGFDVWFIDNQGHVVGIPRSSTVLVTTTEGSN